MESHNKLNTNNLLDYLFWFCLILYSNPGGIQNAFNLAELTKSGINLNDIIFVFLFIFFLLIPKQRLFIDKSFLKISRYLILFILYFTIGFGYLIPIFKQVNSFSTIDTFIKLRHSFYSFGIFFFSYAFILRSFYIFLKIFLISSFSILLLFIISFSLSLNILPLVTIDRGFVDVDRIMLLSYGIMPLLIPIGAVLIIFKINIKYQKLIILGSILMFSTWIISLTRRHIIGSLFYIIIVIAIYYYIHRIGLNRQIRAIIRIAIILAATFSFLIILFPTYYKALTNTTEETINVIRYGETSTGTVDNRFNLKNEVISNLFKNNYLVGTGFDNNWRTKEGDELGYEASDYPLLSAFAMYGIIGVLLFIPIYIEIIKNLLLDLKHRRILTARRNELHLLHISLVVFFIFDLLKYNDYFSPISNSGNMQWYFYLALYLGVRNLIKNEYPIPYMNSRYNLQIQNISFYSYQSEKSLNSINKIVVL